MAKEKRLILKFTLNPAGMECLVEAARDLGRISDTCVLRLTPGDIVSYALIGQGSNIGVFKSTVLPEGHLTVRSGYPEGEDVVFIVKEAKRFHTGLSTYRRRPADVTIEVNYIRLGEVFYGDLFRTSDGRTKLSFISGSPVSANVSITEAQIREYTDPSRSRFSFDMGGPDFDEVRRLMTLDPENDIIRLSVEDGVVSLGEAGWSISVSEVQGAPITELCLPKKYLKAIDPGGGKWTVFDTFIMSESPSGSRILVSAEVT